MKRFIYILSVFCLFTLFFQTAQGQTVNRKLYLKSGNLLDRTVGSSKVNSGVFSKTGAVKDSVSFKTTGSKADPSSFLVVNHVTTSNSDRLMVVSIASTIKTGSNASVDSVKYGTQKLTLLDSGRIVGSKTAKIEVWYLLNPISGTAAVTPYWQSNLEASMGVVTFYNVDQENPILSYKIKSSATNPNNFFVKSNFDDFIFDAIATTASNSGVPDILSGGTQYVRTGSNDVSLIGAIRRGNVDSTQVGYSGALDYSILIALTLSGNSSNETFKLKPALCNPLVIKAGREIEIKTFANITLTSGSTLNTTPPIKSCCLK